MRVLLTGWRGFIGRVLERRLTGQGATVLRYEGNVREIATFAERCDVAVHLAARTRSARAPGADLETMETNVLGTAALTEYARRFSCPVVFTSTCAVYGLTRTGERLSEAHETAPQETGGLSKLLAEQALLSSASLHGFGVVVLRLFNVYGAGQPRGYLISDLIHALQVREPVRLHNPRSVRDFVHVDDVCEAIGKAIETSAPREVRVFNVGTGKGTAVLEVARALARLAGSDYWFEAGSGEDTSVIVADPTAALSQLQWKAEIDLTAGLASMLRAGA